MSPATTRFENSPIIEQKLAKARGGVTLGHISAPVTITVFADLHCGMCKRAFEDIIPRIMDKFVGSGQVKFVFREYPLGFREQEVLLAEAALCANDQGRYFDFLTKLYHEWKTDGATVARYGAELSLETSTFTRCLTSRRYRPDVKRDYELGNELGIEGTPTFFIDGFKIVGVAHDARAFERIVEEALVKKRSPKGPASAQ